MARHRPVVDVVGLGPGGADLITAGTAEVLTSGRAVYLRTARHPAASVVPTASTFDELYETLPTFDEVYATVVDRLVDAATASPAGVVYAVPGSPLVAEHTVELLIADDRVDAIVHPAMSFLDLTWVRLGVDPFSAGVRVVDGHSFAVEAAGERGPLLVAQCDSRDVLSVIKLSVEEPPTAAVTVLQRLGLPDESLFTVGWDDLDRSFEPDHLTSIWIPELAEPVAVEVARFNELMRSLRAQDPWKMGQTHDSLKRYLLEEAYEVLEAIDAYDPDDGAGAEELCEELGDLLYQVVFHSAIGAEAGWFNLADVARSIHDKLVDRHADVAATVQPDAPAEDWVAGWEQSKRERKGRESAFDGIPVSFPALARALKVGKKADALGLADPDPAESLRRSVADLETGGADASTVGSVLFDLAELARASGIDPEDALRLRVDRQVERYRTAEADPG